MISQELADLLKIKPEFIKDSSPKPYTLTIQFNSMSSGTLPHIQVLVNNKIYFDDLLTDGINRVTMTIDNTNCKQLLKVVLDNKQPGDTKVDSQGNIIADKRVSIESIHINNLNIRNYIYKARYKRLDKVPTLAYNDTLAFNGVWRLAYKNPVIDHLAQYTNYGLFDSDEKKQLHDKYFTNLIEIYQKRYK